MNRKERKLAAENTISIIDKGQYINSKEKNVNFKAEQEFAEQNTVLYDIDNSQFEWASLENITRFEVNDLTSLDAARNLIDEGLENVYCLNFASAMNPGGGFLSGSQAQEESLARSSGLYNCLLKADRYYSENRKNLNPMYSDLMIYSPHVPVFKYEDGSLMDEFSTISFITAPAVNVGKVKKNAPESLHLVEETMVKRIEAVLSIALHHGHEHIVLGAWGCGVFQNDPEDIAKLFKNALFGQFKNCFKTVVFAIYARDERFITPFRNQFST